DDCYRGDQALFFLNENKLSVLFHYKARSGRSAIVLSRPPRVVRMDRTVLTKPQEIIDAVRAASNFTADQAKQPITVLCPTPIGMRSLVLPADQRVEKLAHSWAA